MTLQTGSVFEIRNPITSLADYRALGGGQGLAAALEKGPEATIAEVKRSGLRGRGGAGFPTGVKWESIANHPCPTKYVVCNGAEGEPGTFKDRWLMRRAPYQVLEGAAIAAFALGAQRAFIALKEIFDEEVAALERALAEMKEDDACGEVPIEIVTGPDTYLFGEEKAMLEAIEGKEALPRILPAFMVGLFARTGAPNPTAVNNVETLANVPAVLRLGADAFRSIGTERSGGSMIFTLSGDVGAPGVYELPLGTPLRELVFDVGGGPPEGRAVKAVFTGASHPILPGDRLDAVLDFETMKEAGSGLGSGGFIVYDDSTCIVEATLVFSRFLYEESCAQCPPCKRNSQEITACLDRIQRGEGTGDDLDTMLDRSESVTGGRICHLPTGEAAIVRSAVERFRDEFEAHLGRPCPNERGLTVPKISDFDEKTGTFAYQERRAT